MDVADIVRWERCRELADLAKISFRFTSNGAELKDDCGFVLGVLHTVDEIYGFLCGYGVRHFPRARGILWTKEQPEHSGNYLWRPTETAPFAEWLHCHVVSRSNHGYPDTLKLHCNGREVPWPSTGEWGFLCSDNSENDAQCE